MKIDVINGRSVRGACALFYCYHSNFIFFRLVNLSVYYLCPESSVTEIKYRFSTKNNKILIFKHIMPKYCGNENCLGFKNLDTTLLLTSDLLQIDV